MSDTPLPPVDELPVLPPLRDGMDVDLAANDKGDLFVFHEKSFSETVDYVLYDLDNDRLLFIGEEGRMQDIGMTIHPPMREKMQNSTHVYIVHVDNGKPGQVLDVPLMIQNYGDEEG